MRQRPAGGPGYAISNPVVLSVLGVAIGLTLLVPVRFLPRGGWPVLLGITLIIVGFGLRIWGWETMRRLATDPDPHSAACRLATGGPFRFTRNPIYLGVVIILVGVAVATASVWLVAFSGFGVVAASYQIRLEERYMAATFGEEYEMYKRLVRRWL